MSALETMRVLDFTQWEAGPTCTQYLAWMGADVVKLEAPGGEAGRRAFATDQFDSQYFCNHNGNKRGLVLDLKSEEGRDLLRRLLPRFDVLVENQGPGVMERLGFDPLAVHGIHPAMIYARVKGFGLSGPYAGYKCFDPLAMAAAGVTSMTGTPETGPVNPGGTFADTGTGIHAAFAVASAYVQQQRTGEGQVIELSMHEVMTMFIRSMASMSWGPDAAATPYRRYDGAPPGGRWQCQGDGPAEFVFVVIANSGMWADFCRATGRTDLVDDERYARARDRLERAGEIREIFQPWFSARSKHEAMAALGEEGVPVSATFDTAEVFRDPHLRERDFFATYEHPEKGEMVVMKPPFRLSASDVPMQRAPLVGEHTREVLAQELGLDDGELDVLAEKGVISGG
jgi:formyl-CoA transferase